MKGHIAVVMCAVFAVSGSALAQRAEPEFVRDAVGIKSMAQAPRLAERKNAAAVVTLASAEAAVPEQLDELYAWNEAGRRPMRNGFTRSIGQALSVDLAQSAVAKGSASVGTVEMTAGGSVIWSGSVKVADANRLRLHLTNISLPANTTFWTYGVGETPIAFGMELVDGEGNLYTPSVGGDTAYLEIEVPGVSSLSRASFRIADVVEIVAPSRSLAAAAKIGSMDDSSCLIDATCVPASIFPSIADYRKGVAHLQYMSGGNSAVCTGGLMNDRDTSTFHPYLLTANHCFDSQASATSLEAFWDYKSATCGGSFPAISSLPRSNGSQMLATNPSTDFTFIKLNSIPGGRVLLGWDASSTAVRNGTKLYRISHPFPDDFQVPAIQAFSMTAVNTTTTGCEGQSRPNFIYSSRGANEGGVYGGSSGSPVLLANGAIVGQLLGACGPSPSDGCDGRNDTVDGALSVTFPAIANYLNATGGGGGTQPCVADATTACMLGNRFRVRVRYRAGFDNGGADTNALVKQVSGFGNASFETGFFYFNSPDNIEMLVKILDQGNVNGQGQPTIAVLFGSATPLRTELTITDTKTGVTKNYLSEFPKMQGSTDFTAFVK